MTYNQNHRTTNELLKFVEDADGNVSVRVTLTDGIHLTEGSALEVYDHRGFLIFKIDEITGDIHHRGGFVKL